MDQTIEKARTMYQVKAIRLVVGNFIVVSVSLAYFVSQYWLFTPFVGFNLFQSGISDWCPTMKLLRSSGMKEKQTA